MALEPVNNSTLTQLNQLNIDWTVLSEWEAEQLQLALSYCEQHSWHVLAVSDEQTRTLEPALSVWQFTVNQHSTTKRIWLISGDLPTLSLPFKAAATAREALLAFSRQYLFLARQLKQAANAENMQPSEEVKLRMQENVKAAADLLVLYHENELWLEE